MSRDAAHTLPAKDPIAGGPLVITELQAVESGVTIRGRFEVPRFARLSAEQARYLETFLRCRGMLNSVERELGISYPTARARLDAVLKALDLHAVREEGGPVPATESTALTETPTEATSPEYDSGGLPEWEPGEPEGGASFEAPAEEASTVGEAPEPDVEPEPEGEPEPEAPRRTRDEILSMLERGEIGVDEVKRELERAR